jgi:phosphoribosylformimino-5-aminoimidazole carboxamide ribotide isomerase
MRFRPCIDLHGGVVTQIIGSTLAENTAPTTNFQAEKPPAWFANRYREDGLTGGHIIQLGPGNADAARSALAAWPGGMQLGGGVTAGQCCLVAGRRGQSCHRDLVRLS